MFCRIAKIKTKINDLRYSTAVLLLAVMALSSCAFQMKPAKDDITGVSEWIIVPVFFATNRLPDQTTAAVDFNEDSNGQELTFGVKSVAVPVPLLTPLEQETVDRMAWKRLQTAPAEKAELPTVKPEKLKIPDRVVPVQEVVQEFAKYKSASKSSRSILFLHGCCATFDTSIARAAKLAVHTQMPVLLFDWVSPKGFKRYLENETRVHQTLDSFYRFLDRIDSFGRPEELILLGHSMGGQFLDQAMVRRFAVSSHGHSLPRYNTLIMSNADVDARSFLNHAQEFSANGQKCLFFVSHDDDRLHASSIAHGGFSRLGAPGTLLSDLAKLEAKQVIDITAAGTGHELPFWVIANMLKFGNLGPVNSFRLEEKKNGYLQLESTTAQP
ncbi:MAG: alpha/beta hydrolase [Candidatus Obscuribacterales bacterium]|nr:alpha/beta hydrolase [Candidatus Obscuribacterales bacterium]